MEVKVIGCVQANYGEIDEADGPIGRTNAEEGTFGAESKLSAKQAVVTDERIDSP